MIWANNYSVAFDSDIYRILLHIYPKMVLDQRKPKKIYTAQILLSQLKEDSLRSNERRKREP